MSTYSSNLKVQLIGTGEQDGSWGPVTNNAFSNVFEQAIVGYATVNFSTDANTTLTLTDGNSSQTARNLYLDLTSSGSLSATRDLILPNNQAGTAPIQKFYIVKNGTTGSQSIRVIGASGTGVTIPNGVTAMVYSNGTNVVDAATYFSSLTLGTPLPIASGGTGSSSTAYVNLTTNVTGQLPVANGGTASSTASGARTALAVPGLADANSYSNTNNFQDNEVIRPKVKDYSMTVNALGNISGATTVNLELGNYVTATCTNNVTWTFSNPAASGSACGFILVLTNGGAYTQTWPASVDWPFGGAPTLTSSGTDVLVFITNDGGTIWRGNISMQDSK